MSAHRIHATRHSSKPKILLDESLPPRRNFPLLNAYCNVRHIKDDYGLGGSPDSTVYEVACSEGRILVTINVKHFRPMLTDLGMTVIGVAPHMTNQQIDKKLVRCIKKLSGSKFKGEYIALGDASH